MNRLYQLILICSVLIMSWLGMQMIHEAGHVIMLWLTGGKVRQVVLNPLAISRTDFTENPKPLLVVWGGPVVGVMAPMLMLALGKLIRIQGLFVVRFFAGFCLIANGLYLAVGSFDRVGDCGVLLQNGAELWQLWLFGALTVPVGFWLWHGQGQQFGLGKANGNVSRSVALTTFFLSVALIVICSLFQDQSLIITRYAEPLR